MADPNEKNEYQEEWMPEEEYEAVEDGGEEPSEEEEYYEEYEEEPQEYAEEEYSEEGSEDAVEEYPEEEYPQEEDGEEYPEEPDEDVAEEEESEYQEDSDEVSDGESPVEKEEKPSFFQKLTQASPYEVMLWISVAVLLLGIFFMLHEFMAYDMIIDPPMN